MPERIQRVQTLALTGVPFFIILTFWTLGVHMRLVFLFEWLTLLPLITPRSQISQYLPIKNTSLSWYIFTDFIIVSLLLVFDKQNIFDLKIGGDIKIKLLFGIRLIYLIFAYYEDILNAENIVKKAKFFISIYTLKSQMKKSVQE